MEIAPLHIYSLSRLRRFANNRICSARCVAEHTLTSHIFYQPAQDFPSKSLSVICGLLRPRNVDQQAYYRISCNKQNNSPDELVFQ